MKVRYFGKYNSEGMYQGFYTSDTWDLENIPMDECIELTEDEWQQALAERCKVVNGKHVYDPYTKEELDDQKLEFVRYQRNKLLAESDWTQMIADNSLSDAKKEEWRIYRQKLRDLPATIDLENMEYPEKPV